uniref:PPPDE domain-containing protein n=1 Tax=Bionectria ochroleuca TaxID=29856 RepID=A0A8H7TIP6_BIOOC
MAPPRSSAGGSRRHRSTLSMQKTEILINVYDLLPPGRLSSILWTVGAGLLHSAVVINGKEYAYGGHDHKNLTGVYWTRPKTEPPGGTFRCEILHGFTLASDEEIENVIREASEEFQGTAYNLLTRNCNHFTSYLPEAHRNTWSCMAEPCSSHWCCISVRRAARMDRTARL